MKNGPYELIVAPEGYPGKKYRNRYAYEHQVVWWQKTGTVVPLGFVIHHKNENKRDNRVENLELISNSQHAAHHQKDAVTTYYNFNCGWCGRKWSMELRNYNSKVKQGRVKFFCSQKCGTLNQFHGPDAAIKNLDLTQDVTERFV